VRRGHEEQLRAGERADPFETDVAIAHHSDDDTTPSTMNRVPRIPLAPRKAPRQGRSEQTVAIILEAAAQVLEASGLEGFNTNAVAQRAGVSIGSLYQYFPGKDALTVALMRREGARFHADVVVALAAPHGRAALDGCIDAAVRQQLARPRLARLLDIEESRPEIQRALEGTPSLRALLEQILTRDDLPPQARPRVVAGDLGAIIRGLTDAAGERGETELADLRHRIAAAVFGYLDAMSGASAAATSPNKPANASKRRPRRVTAR